MPLNFCREITPENPDLKWAIGTTGRTSFLWTVIPPGTAFCMGGDAAEDYYFSIFKWTHPLWSALDIKIDVNFISYLRTGHFRKEFNRQYQGCDYDDLKAPGGLPKRPLPLGNHVISVCQAAGILQREKRGGFFLSLPGDCFGNKIGTVRNALRNYLEKTKVSRGEIENFEKYKIKKDQWDHFKNMKSEKNMELIWKKADVPQMNDIPADEELRERIRQRLIDFHKSRIEDAVLLLEQRVITGTLADFELDFSSSTRRLKKEMVKTAARDYVRSAWKDVQNSRSE